MKTEHEANVIQGFCDGLSNALTESGNPAWLTYENKGEYVTGSVNDHAVQISVNWSCAETAARDIIRGVNRILEGVEE